MKRGSRMTSKRRVLEALRDGNWHSAIELCKPSIGGIAFNQRIGNLRASGLMIESEKIPDRSYYRYRLDTPLEKIDFEGCKRIWTVEEWNNGQQN